MIGRHVLGIRGEVNNFLGLEVRKGPKALSMRNGEGGFAARFS